MDDDAPQREAEYQAARAAYNAALARLVAARKARPKPPPLAMRKTRDRVWQAYVARDLAQECTIKAHCEALAAEFALSPSYVREIVNDGRFQAKYLAKHGLRRAEAAEAEREWLRENGFTVTGG